MTFALLGKLTAIAACVYLAIGAALYFAQRRILYVPDPTRVAPAAIGLTYVDEVLLGTPDGETLVAWHGAPAPGKRTLLYFHGNGGGLAGREDRIRAYRGFGFGLMMLAYRGYSGSTGAPSEAANMADAQIAYDWLRARGAAASDIVLYGESLGTGIAVRIAADNVVGGIVLDAPYTSVADIAATRYPWLPVRALLRDQYDSRALIGRLRAPLLVIHGEKDDIVPIAMGRAMYEAATVPKTMQVYPRAGHLYHLEFGSAEVVRRFVDGL